MKPNNHYLSTFVFLLFTALSFSCSTDIPPQSGYLINGKIIGIDTGMVHLSKLDLTTNEETTVDSASIINGHFRLSGKVNSPYAHTLFINDKSHKIHFFVENSIIDLNADINDLTATKVIGSREDSLFRSVGLDDIFDRKKGMDIMLQHPDYVFAAFTAYYQFQIYNIEFDTMEYIMNSFAEPVKKSVYFEHLNTLYTTLKQVAIGQPAPHFKLPDTSGVSVQLTDFRGQYVFIDFWASWCAPCRAANPKLVETYQQFHDKNFTIIGISVDKNRADWLNAIAEDHLPWINLSDLKGWSDVSTRYAVKAIPQNFLINPSGHIIDKNIDPDNILKVLGNKIK